VAGVGAVNDDTRDYPPIADHGLIGDLRTAALVGTDGTIDWFCAPRFDSPSVFGSLLDAERGGHWRIFPLCPVLMVRQFYFPDSNVLVTRFHTEDGVVEVQDFMVVMREHDPEHRQRLVRRIAGVRGTVRVDVHVAARMDYGRVTPGIRRTPRGIRFDGPELALDLRADVELDVDDGDVRAQFDVDKGDEVLFVLEVPEDGSSEEDVRGQELFEATTAFWRRWIGKSQYAGRWREMVHRSALTLKLLTHEPSGAIIAAPTTGLPEQIGGGRNWDYRYVWIRDAAFSLYALLRLGFTDEAEAFMHWLTDRLADGNDGERGPLRVMYTIDGKVDLDERELGHLAGYRGSSPVRIGNAAAEQLQLDIYGELIDSVYLFNKHGPGISYDSWRDLTDMLDWLHDNWDRPDEGVWEVRSGRHEHTFSRLMCWVAFERTIRMSRQRGLPGGIEAWIHTRDAIYRQIMESGWNAQRGAFVEHYGSTVLDAALLLMPMVKFCAPTDPRFLSTLDAIAEELVTDSLVFRYDLARTTDGLDGTDATFSMCSFWYVEALTRAGRLDQARLALEKMFTYANHVGLYAEQIGLTGEQLGNFPQAFTHLSLISAAINLDRALDGGFG
jgi:GH15 family glucan-1,4-alpha-glucosidase